MKCDEMHCAAICEPKAITRDEATGVMHIDTAACTGCKRCISACRYGGIAYDWVADKALVCDLCEGDPTCVRNCWSSALSVIDVEDSPDLRTTALEEARYRHETYCQVVIPE
jgi:Fe-S-cluster-containing hydrogenase component 2